MERVCEFVPIGTEAYASINGELVYVKVRESIYTFDKNGVNESVIHICDSPRGEMRFGNTEFYNKDGKRIVFSKNRINTFDEFYYVKDSKMCKFVTNSKACNMRIDKNNSSSRFCRMPNFYLDDPKVPMYEAENIAYFYNEIKTIEEDGRGHVSHGLGKAMSLNETQTEIIKELQSVIAKARENGVEFALSEWSNQLHCYNTLNVDTVSGDYNCGEIPEDYTPIPVKCLCSVMDLEEYSYEYCDGYTLGVKRK